MEHKMGSKLILLLGLIVGTLLTLFCVNKDKREHLFNSTKLLNRNTTSNFKQIDEKNITIKEPIVTDRVEKIEDTIKEENSSANSSAVDIKRKELEHEEIKKEELKKLKETEEKITQLLKDNPIYFKTSNSTIKESSKKGLNRIAEALKSISDNTIVLIKGHTDASGKASLNKNLSQKRANSVMFYLKKGGLDSLSMRAIGYGEEQPIVVSNPNDKLNRRVEIELKRGE